MGGLHIGQAQAASPAGQPYTIAAFVAGASRRVPLCLALRRLASRPLTFLGCMGVLLVGWVLASGPVGAQHATVEWLEFDCEGARCLVLNAYHSEDDHSTNGGVQDGRVLLASDEVTPILLRLPVTTVPPRSVLNPFLKTLGVPDLEALEENLPHVEGGPSESSELDLWSVLVGELQNRTDVRIGEGYVRSTEVADDLKRVYAGQGYPSDEQPLLPHLVRGVLAVYDEHGDVADTTRTLAFGATEVGVPHYTTVRFVNLGSRPLHVYASRELFSGARLSEADFSLPPGKHMSRLLRYEAGLVSLLRGRGRAAVGYESEGERRTVLRLEGVRAASAPSMLASTARVQIASHRGYWHELPLYRFALLLVAFGGVVLAAVMGVRTVPVAVARARRLRSTWPLAVSRMRQHSSEAAARANERAAVCSSNLTQAGFWLVAQQRRIARLLSLSARRLGTLAGPWLQRTGSGAGRAAGRTAAFTRNRLERTWTRVTHGREPVSGRACVDHIQQLSKELRSPREVRREAIRLARRLDADLQSERLPLTVEHLQILWALRLLRAALTRRAADPHEVLEQWLRGAAKVLEEQGRMGIGPTNSEFIELL